MFTNFLCPLLFNTIFIRFINLIQKLELIIFSSWKGTVERSFWICLQAYQTFIKFFCINFCCLHFLFIAKMLLVFKCVKLFAQLLLLYTCYLFIFSLGCVQGRNYKTKNFTKNILFSLLEQKYRARPICRENSSLSTFLLVKIKLLAKSFLLKLLFACFSVLWIRPKDFPFNFEI